MISSRLLGTINTTNIIFFYYLNYNKYDIKNTFSDLKNLLKSSKKIIFIFGYKPKKKDYLYKIGNIFFSTY